MKAYFRSLQIFLKQIWEDSMLAAVCAVPLLIALVFRFGVPVLENVLCTAFGQSSILADYYLLFDLFLAVMTPYMFTFVSAMVMLTERDENMAVFLAVTPITKKGYIISRLVLPAMLSFAVSAVLLGFFALSRWTVGGILLAAVLFCLLSIPTAMLIVAFSHNRVEGMAVAKISGLLLFGLPVPFFLEGAAQYLFAFLPSFWAGKVFEARVDWPAVFAVMVSLGWMWALYQRFDRKMI